MCDKNQLLCLANTTSELKPDNSNELCLIDFLPKVQCLLWLLMIGSLGC